MRTYTFADSIIAGIMEDERYQEIVCEGCRFGSMPEGCPFDYDFYDKGCPQRHEVHNMETSVRATLNSYGIE